MKRMSLWSKALLVFFALMLSLQTPILALTQRPQYDEHGNLTPNPFAEGDALRYGGLFGPLPKPDPIENWRIAEKNPELVEPLGGLGTSLGISARDLGFGSGNDRYIPINRERSSY